MGVYGAGNVLRCAAELHGGHQCTDQFRGIGTDNMCAQDSIALTVAQNFYHAYGITHGMGATVPAKGENTRAKIRITGFQLLTGEAAPAW